jgi:hypothetical protein
LPLNNIRGDAILNTSQSSNFSINATKNNPFNYNNRISTVYSSKSHYLNPTNPIPISFNKRKYNNTILGTLLKNKEISLSSHNDSLNNSLKLKNN